MSSSVRSGVACLPTTSNGVEQLHQEGVDLLHGSLSRDSCDPSRPTPTPSSLDDFDDAATATATTAVPEGSFTWSIMGSESTSGLRPGLVSPPEDQLVGTLPGPLSIAGIEGNPDRLVPCGLGRGGLEPCQVQALLIQNGSLRSELAASGVAAAKITRPTPPGPASPSEDGQYVALTALSLNNMCREEQLLDGSQQRHPAKVARRDHIDVPGLLPGASSSAMPCHAILSDAMPCHEQNVGNQQLVGEQQYIQVESSKSSEEVEDDLQEVESLRWHGPIEMIEVSDEEELSVKMEVETAYEEGGPSGEEGMNVTPETPGPDQTEAPEVQEPHEWVYHRYPTTTWVRLPDCIPYTT